MSRRNDFKCGRDVIREANRRDYEVKESRGSHFRVRKDNGDTLTAYHGELSRGVRRIVLKFFMSILVAIGSLALVSNYFATVGG